MSDGTIGDAGEIVLGARKHQYGKGLTNDDLIGLTPEEATKLLTKNNVWPQPDYVALVAEGLDPVVAALRKIVRDRIAAMPDLNADGYSMKSGNEVREDYIAVLTSIRQVMDTLSTSSAFSGLYELVRADLGFEKRRRSDTEAWNKTSLAKKKGMRQFPFDIYSNDMKRATKMVSEGFPAAKSTPDWLRKLKVVQHAETRLWLAVQRGVVVASGLASEEEAFACAKLDWDRQQAETPNEPIEPPTRAALQKLERHGLPDWRATRDIGSSEFIAHFGFRAVQWGESIPQKERQAILNHAYDALNDLAHILDMDVRSISLDGFMAAAFGARGQGSASAHYEPGKRIFNLGRMNGAGCLAHEWAHGFDNAAAEYCRFEETRGNARYATEGLYNSNLSRVQGASVDRLMGAILRRQLLRDEKIAQLEAALAEKTMPLDRQKLALESGSVPENKVAITQAYIERQAVVVESARNTLEDVRHLPADYDFGAIQTDYANEAVKLCGKSGKYWKRNIELFARAFECSIFDRLEQMGAKSDFLVHSVEEDRYADAEVYRGNPYPCGAERSSISEAVFDMVEELKVCFAPDDELSYRDNTDIGAHAGL